MLINNNTAPYFTKTNSKDIKGYRMTKDKEKFTMKKLDRETKTLICISLSLTGIIASVAFSGGIAAIAYGLLWLLKIEINDIILLLLIIFSSIIGFVLALLMQRSKYLLFKERHGFD